MKKAPADATYLSPDIQNEFINLCDEIRIGIMERCQQPDYFSIMADECQDVSSLAQLSLCVRYLTGEFDVVEYCIGFVELPRTNAETISTVII